MNSEGHRFALAGVHLDDLDWKRHVYTGLKSYGAAKTAQLLAMMKFADYFSDSLVTVNAMHPGNVKSAIGENNGRLYRMSEKEADPPLRQGSGHLGKGTAVSLGLRGRRGRNPAGFST